MISLLKGMFSSGDTANKIVDGAVNGLDAVFYTEEEKAQANQKLLDWKLKWLEATRPQNISRRFIAIIVTLLWALLIILMVAAEAMGASGFATYVFTVLKDIVALPFGIIIGFYFAAHITKGLKNSEN